MQDRLRISFPNQEHTPIAKPEMIAPDPGAIPGGPQYPKQMFEHGMNFPPAPTMVLGQDCGPCGGGTSDACGPCGVKQQPARQKSMWHETGDPTESVVRGPPMSICAMVVITKPVCASVVIGPYADWISKTPWHITTRSPARSKCNQAIASVSMHHGLLPCVASMLSTLAMLMSKQLDASTHWPDTDHREPTRCTDSQPVPAVGEVGRKTRDDL